MTKKFKDEVEAIKGKSSETDHIINEIAKATKLLPLQNVVSARRRG